MDPHHNGTNYSGVVYKVQFSHLVIINVALILPGALHFIEKRKHQRLRCSNFMERVIFGCTITSLNWLMGMFSTIFSPPISLNPHICYIYKLIPSVILIWLTASAVLYHVKSAGANTIGYACIVWLLVVWAVLAALVRLMLSLTDVGNQRCLSLLMTHTQCSSCPDVVPVVPALVLLHSVMYVPPAVLVLGAWIIGGVRKSIMKPKDITPAYNEMCPTCARTLVFCDTWWWKALLCTVMGVARTNILLNDCIANQQFRDLPPIIIIVTVFYPLCCAQGIYYLKTDTASIWRNQVKHV